jgi:1-acyl-sn-glycerol-3-phosphate acyltransferase
MSDARAGAAWLAVNGHAPVVPVAILGTRLPGGSTGGFPALRTRFYLEFGEPIELAVADRPRRVAIGEGTERIRLAMAALVKDAASRTGRVLPGPVNQGQ